MSDERDRLQRAVERLEQVTEGLRSSGEDRERVDELADDALRLSAEISELLPRVIRQIEDAAQGRLSEG